MPLENNCIKIPLGMGCCRLILFLLPMLISSCLTTHPFALRYNKLGTLKDDSKMTMPTGADTYFEMVSKGLFVDKSLFIKEVLLKAASERVTIITFPKRWGKTMNLMMVKEFLQIGIYQNGTLMKLTDTPSYKFFVMGIVEIGRFHLPASEEAVFSKLSDTEQMKKSGLQTNSVDSTTETKPLSIKLNETLLIASKQYYPILNKYLGRYPVILISFLPFERGPDPASTFAKFRKLTDPAFFLAEFKTVISESFLEHRYMLNILQMKSESPLLSKSDRKYFAEQHRKFESFLYGQNDLEVHLSLQFLSQVLYDHFKQKVFILIDEYDAIFRIPDVDTSIYLRFLSRSTKINKNLERAIITGMLPILMGVNSIMNDCDQHQFVNSPFHKYYGYTPQEVQLLVEYYGLSNEQKNEVEYWYDGFHTSDDEISRVYNPWSTNNYMKKDTAGIYWVMSTDHIFEMKIVFNREAFTTLELLIQSGKPHDICFNSLILKRDELRILKKFGRIVSNSTHLCNIALKYFLFAGYLIMTSVTTPRNELHCGVLSIPNEEIRRALIEINEIYIVEMNKPEWTLIEDIRKEWYLYFSNNGGNCILLQQKLQQYLEVYPDFLTDSTHSILRAQYGNEAVIESTFSITLRSINTYDNFYSIQYQNKIDGSVIRPDILLASSTLGVLIEFKYRQNAQSALNQAQKYSIIFNTLRRFATINKILYIGCNVNGQKNVHIVSKLKDFEWDDRLVKEKEVSKKVQHVKKMEKQKARRDKKLDKNQLKTTVVKARRDKKLDKNQLKTTERVTRRNE